MKRFLLWSALMTATLVSVPGRALVAQRGLAHAGAAGDGTDASGVLDRKVTIDVTNVSLERAIQTAAARASAIALVNRSALARYERSVTFRAKDESLRAVFNRLLAGTTLQVIVQPRARLIVTETGGRPLASSAPDSTGVVSGTVVDSATGQPIAHATVKVGGTTLSATTNEKGGFIVRDVPIGEVSLSVQTFGYRPVVRAVTIASTAPTVVHVGLAPTATVLSGVVTTATGTQRKLEVGSDITTLNVDSIMRVAPITSVTDLLESRVPGVTVQRTSGTPGAPARVRLRGVGSISRNNDPIVIVDGVRVYAAQSDVRNTDTLGRTANGSNGLRQATAGYAAPSPLDQIDPNSIETLEVLKGPSASAMYGSDAGNGVIVITTKHGRAGPTRGTLTLGQGRSFQPGTYPLGVYRFGHYYNGPSQFCALADPLCTVDSVVAFQALNDPRYAVTTGHGNMSELSGTASGGVSTLTYALTGSYAHTTGQLTLPGVEVERFTAVHGFTPPNWMRRPDRYSTAGGSSRLDLPISTKGGRAGTVTLTSSLFKSDQQQSSLQTAIGALLATYVDTTQLAPATLVPEFYERATHGSVNFTNALTLSWPVASWLPLTATGGVNLMNTIQQTLTPRDYLTNADSVGFFATNRGNATQYTLNMNTAMPSRWARTAVGFNFTQQAVNDIGASVTGLPIGVNNPGSLVGLTSDQPGRAGQASTASATYGWFVAPTLNFRSRFFATPGLRLDGGSASGGRVSTSVGGRSIRGVSGFPKMDFSYLVLDPADEGNRRGALTAVSLLRLRGAFGTAGRQPDPADQLRLFTPAVVPALGDQPALDVLSLSSLGNTVLRPERTQELEYGFDTELWRGRLALGVTGARKLTRDAIIRVSLPASIAGIFDSPGTLAIPENLGTVRNTDLELTARAAVLQRAAVAWDVNGTLTRSTNLVVRLDPSLQVISAYLAAGVGNHGGIGNQIRAGYPINGVWARPILGYADINHDGIIQSGEVLVGDSARYLGQPLPTYQAAFSTNVALVGGRLSAHSSLAYQHGMTQFNSVGTGISNVSSCTNGRNCIYAATPLFGNDASASLGQQAAFAAFSPLDPHHQTPYGLVQTVNTLRWQDFSLNYVAPQAMARLVRAPRLLIALQGSNLALHTNYHGKDPNVNAFSSGEQVLDAGQLPQPRTFTLKVTLGN